MPEQREKLEPCNLMLEDRCRLRLTGVQDVDSFDEKTITAYTVKGELMIAGDSLHICNLSTDNGELTVEGEISSLVFTDEEPRGGGFFGRLFR